MILFWLIFRETFKRYEVSKKGSHSDHRGGSEPTKSHECLEQEVFQKVGKRYYEFPKICDLFSHVLVK